MQNGTTRRQALCGLAAVTLAGVAPDLARPARAGTPNDHRDTLDAFVDILLPPDDLTPAASALGVGASIADLAKGQTLLAALIQRVGDWMDSTGAGRFVALTAADRATLVDYMAQADIDTLEGRFFQLIRLFAIEFYYDHPAAIAGLALDPAPQPSGYPPPWV